MPRSTKKTYGWGETKNLCILITVFPPTEKPGACEKELSKWRKSWRTKIWKIIFQVDTNRPETSTKTTLQRRTFRRIRTSRSSSSGRIPRRRPEQYAGMGRIEKREKKGPGEASPKKNERGWECKRAALITEGEASLIFQLSNLANTLH